MPPRKRALQPEPSDPGNAPTMPRKAIRDLAAHAASQRLGPKDLQEIFDWPDKAWPLIFGPDVPNSQDRLAALQAHVARGLSLRTQYSGKGTAEHCFQHIVQKIHEEKIKEHEKMEWHMLSAFDKKPAARDALLQCKAEKHGCVFGNFLSALSMKSRDAVLQMEPARTLPASERQEAYQKMGQYLSENLKESFPSEVKATCWRHTTMFTGGCPVWADDKAAMEIWCAGQVCKDFSRRGLMEGDAGPHTGSYKVWMSMVRARKPRIFIHEITVSQAAEAALKEDLEDLYLIKTITGLCPSMFGIPAQRERQFSVGTLKNVVVNTGSWEEFLNLMGSKCQLDGSVFFCSSEEHRREVVQGLAAKNGWHYSADDNSMPPLSEHMTPAEIRRIDDYETKFQQKLMRPGNGGASKRHRVAASGSSGTATATATATAAASELSGFFCCDVTQNAMFGTVAHYMPCLTSHGKLAAKYPDGSLKVAVPLEHLVLMGDCVLPDIPVKYSCQYADFAWENRLNGPMLKDLAGNAQHTTLLGYVMLYWIACVVELPQEMNLCAFRSSYSMDFDFDEEEAKGDGTD